jgi:threonine dehydrogenase-like Zn-dependent dehydrogenase
MGANLMGAGRVIAVESRPERQAMAKKFGADDIVDFTQGDGFDDVETAFAMMTTKDDGIIKPLITFG